MKSPKIQRDLRIIPLLFVSSVIPLGTSGYVMIANGRSTMSGKIVVREPNLV